ncbi:hypothetical protein [Kingella sp. (in: b-proteobacteria)]|nr:hypothetical protein [Kingella sp. (in: b-proteobacteria)]MDO4657284.1 hypothetical protein [Kingella sp. (in: b-proteobacteria)]
MPLCCARRLRTSPSHKGSLKIEPFAVAPNGFLLDGLSFRLPNHPPKAA